tara:strand:- start:1603 stop:2955 length:1353 start_codon:yes stop_codon:yes gene_type:complete
MQTPGRRLLARTPMFSIGRNMSSLANRLSSLSQPSTKIERPQNALGTRVVSQLEVINTNLDDMKDLIRKDITDKGKYYREESKILKEDSDNLGKIRTAAFFGERSRTAALLGALGAGQLGTGNIGGAAQSFGGAAALMTPEIVNFLTGAVVNVLALKGLIGGGKGAGGLARTAGSASKLKNPLLITAALAASLLIPSLIKSGNTADRRRQTVATRAIRGKEVINKPDVDRFRGLLSRFSGILDRLGGKTETAQGSVDERFFEDEKDNLQVEGLSDKDYNRLIDQLKSDVKSENKNETTFDTANAEVTGIEGIVSGIEGDNIAYNDESTVLNPTLEGDTTFTQGDIFVSPKNNSRFTINPSVVNNFEPGESKNDISLSFSDTVESNVKTTSNNTSSNLIDLSNNNEQEQPQSSGFSGEAAKTSNVAVSTRYNNVDLFDISASYKNYGAFNS